MVKVKEIFSFLNELSPVARKMDFDNVGLLVGSENADVSKIMVTLDITEKVALEAAEMGAELIVSHHPVIFNPMKRITDDTPEGRRILALIKNGISAICMHTNLDCSKDGVNDALAKKLGITEFEGFVEPMGDICGEFGLGRYGYIDDPKSMSDFLPYVKAQLNSKGLRYYDAGKKVSKLAVIGGSGGSEMELAVKLGCDTLVTADVKYDVFLNAAEYGLNLIDADHFCTENVITPVLSKNLSDKFPEIEVSISKIHSQTVSFY